MCEFYVLYNGFYVSDSIAVCWATSSAFYALLSSHVMTNKDDDDAGCAGEACLPAFSPH